MQKLIKEKTRRQWKKWIFPWTKERIKIYHFRELTESMIISPGTKNEKFNTDERVK